MDVVRLSRDTAGSDEGPVRRASGAPGSRRAWQRRWDRGTQQGVAVVVAL